MPQDTSTSAKSQFHDVSQWPLVSLIIPTYKREKYLIATVQDALDQEYPEFEVLVMDQTPQNASETEREIEKFQQDQRFKYYRLPWASLTGARNWAARRAQGQILIFIDDDVKLKPSFIRSHVTNFLEKPEVGGVAGRVLDQQKLKENPEDLKIHMLPPQAMEPAIGLFFVNLVHTVEPQEVITARGCNMSFRKEVFQSEKVFFDERFSGNAIREESDFCFKIRNQGWKIWYDPHADLIHWGEPTGGVHELNRKSLTYQLAFFHNHFLLAFNSLKFSELPKFCYYLWNYQVLGKSVTYHHNPAYKIILRGIAYGLGMGKAGWTWLQSFWDTKQEYTKQDSVSWNSYK